MPILPFKVDSTTFLTKGSKDPRVLHKNQFRYSKMGADYRRRYVMCRYLVSFLTQLFLKVYFIFIAGLHKSVMKHILQIANLYKKSRDASSLYENF